MTEFDWETSINNRRSTRSYEAKALDKRSMALLKSFISDMEVPFEHTVKLALFKAAPTKKLYMVFESPADNVAFISETDDVSISKTGFVGELFVLYATHLGISTCWYGHYNSAEMAKLLPHSGGQTPQTKIHWGYGKGIAEGRRVIAVSPLGYWNGKGMRIVDPIQEKTNSYKRKAIDELLLGDVREAQLSEPLRHALDLARKAPSAMNSQFWRYTVRPDQKLIRVSMPEGYKHPKWEHPNVDIGITACHLWLGLTQKGIQCKIDVRENSGCAVWEFSLP